MNSQTDLTAIMPVAHGILDESAQDTLHIHWILTRECDYRCSYCDQWSDGKDTIYTKERLLTVAHALLSANRPYYSITFTGGEPTMHPLFPELIDYLYSTNIPLGITIETNGQQTLDYYNTLLKSARPNTLQVVITVHMDHADLANICLLIASIAEKKQLVAVRLVLDPEYKEKVRQFHSALTALRKSVCFDLEIWPLVYKGKPDSRYTAVDYRIWKEADQNFARVAHTSLPLPAMLPHSQVQCRYEDAAGQIHIADAKSIEKEIIFPGLHCCGGFNFLCIHPDGSCTDTLCQQAESQDILWKEKRNIINTLGRIRVCTSAQCPHVENDIIPKFRNMVEAESYLDKSRERALAVQASCIPLPHPVRIAHGPDEVIRVRLKRMKPVRVSQTTLPAATGTLIKYADDICLIYEALQEDSQELFLRALLTLETGKIGYLPTDSTVDSVLESDSEILLHFGISEYVELPLHYVKEHPEHRLSLRCVDRDSGTLALYPVPCDETQTPEPAPIWPTTVFPDRISVIIPVHDNESTIRRSLDSALIQGVEDLEIIVVDSNSHDGTAEILEEYRRRYPEQIRLLHLAENQGPGMARNAGMKVATGFYTAFLDSDDAMHEHFLAHALEALRSSQSDVAAFDLLVVHENGNKTSLGVKPGVYSGEEALSFLLCGKMGGYSINNKLYTTKSLRDNEICFNEIVVHHDLLFNVSALWKASKVTVVDSIGYTQYKRRNAVGNRNNHNSQIDAFATAIEKLYTFFVENGLDTSSVMFGQCIHRMYEFNRPYILQTLKTASDTELSKVLPDSLLQRFSGSHEAVRLLLEDTVSQFDRTGYEVLLDERDAFLHSGAVPRAELPICIACGESDASTGTLPLLSIILLNTGHEWELELCLERLTFQDLSRAEVVLVGVADETKHTFFEEVASSFPQIRMYCAPEGTSTGICCRLAVEKSTASHVLLIETNDSISTGFVATACELIESRQPDAVFFSVNDKNVAMPSRGRHFEDTEWIGLDAVRQALLESSLRDLRGVVLRTALLLDVPCHDLLGFCSEAIALYVIGHSERVLTSAQMALSCMSSDIKQDNSKVTRSTIHDTYTVYALLQQIAEYHKSAELAELEVYCHNYLLSIFLPQCAAFQQATDSIPFTAEDHYSAKSPLFLRALWKIRAETYEAEISGAVQGTPLLPFKQNDIQPLISVILPLREKYEGINACLDMLLHQTVSSLEILILDNTIDGSHNPFLCTVSEQDPRIKIVSVNTLSDPASLYEQGLRITTGIFILFIEPNDSLNSDVLLRASVVLRRLKKVDAVCLDGAEHTMRDFPFTPRDILLERLAQDSEHRAWLTNGTLFRRELFENGFRLWSSLDARNVYLWAIYTKIQYVAGLDLSGVRKAIADMATLPSSIHFAQLLELSLCSVAEGQLSSDVHMVFLKRQLLPYLKKCLTVFPRTKDTGLLAFTEHDLHMLTEANMMSRIMLDDCANLYANSVPKQNFLPFDPLCRNIADSPLVFCGTSIDTSSSVDISVILIISDAEKTLSVCLDRLVTQEEKSSFEILLIDNASQDATLRVCQEYADRYSCIRVYRTLWKTPITGLRNLALNEVRGERFVFTHTGVMFAPYALSRMVSQLNVQQGDANRAISLVFNHTGKAFSVSPAQDTLSAELENCILFPIECQILWNRVLNTSVWRNHALEFMSEGEMEPVAAMQMCLIGKNVWTSSMLTDESLSEFTPDPVSAEHELCMTIRQLCSLGACIESMSDDSSRQKAIPLLSTLFNTGLGAAFLQALCERAKDEKQTGLTVSQFDLLAKHEALLRVLFSYYAGVVNGQPAPTDSSPSGRTRYRTSRQTLSTLPHPTPLNRPQSGQFFPSSGVQSSEFLPAVCPQNVQSLSANCLESFPIELTPEEQELAKTDPKLAEVKALSRSGLFDAEYYLRTYPDVANSGIDPVTHYVYHGKDEGRSCGGFLPTKRLPFSGQPKVSVIVPVYNNAQYLHECIDSIINQTLKEIEIIIVNDGSTDQKAVDILNEYAQKDARIKLIHKKNTGYGHTMNVGMDAATGEYIGIVESDDYILSDMYKKLYCIAKSTLVEIVKCNYRLFYGDIAKTRTFEDKMIYNNIKYYDSILYPQEDKTILRMLNTNWNGLFSRYFLNKFEIRFNETPGASFQDNGFWFLSICRATQIYCTNDFYYMLRRDNPNSSVMSREKVFCMCDEYEYICAYLKKNMIYDKFVSMYVFKKFQNYNFTLDRISEKFKKDFLLRYSMEFRAIYKKGEIDKSVFSEHELKRVSEIIAFSETVSKSNDPKISIVVPIYNTEKFLRQCLYSIMNQTLPEIEIICVNDGSSDDSISILRELSERDNRIQIIDKANSGYGNSVNIGISSARGIYIAIVESDDYIDKDMYKELYNSACEYNNCVDVVKSSFYEVHNNDLGEEIKKLSVISEKLKHCKIKFNISENNEILFHHPSIWSAIYKKDYLLRNNIKFIEASGAGWVDNPFFFATLCLAKEIVFINKPLYFYRVDNQESSSNMIDSSAVFSRLSEIHNFISNNNLNVQYILEPFYKRILIYLKKLLISSRNDFNFFSDACNVVSYIDISILHRCKSISQEELSIYNRYSSHNIITRKGNNNLVFSVIIPVYNSESFLEQCIESVANQTCRDIEIICINDGSTDNSLSILLDYAKRDSRIVIVNQNNRGAGYARNVGLKLAKGEYLSFLDADDFFEETMLDVSCKKCRETQSDIAIFKSDIFNNKTKKFEHCSWALREHILPYQNPFSYKDHQKYFFNFANGWAWDKVFRRKFILDSKIYFQEQQTTNDMFFVFYAMAKAKKIYIIDSIFAHYRINAAKTLSVSREKTYKCFYYALIALKYALKEEGVYDILEQSFVNWALNFSLWNINTISNKYSDELKSNFKRKYIHDLDIYNKDKSYFYNTKDYNQLIDIIS